MTKTKHFVGSGKNIVMIITPLKIDSQILWVDLMDSYNIVTKQKMLG